MGKNLILFGIVVLSLVIPGLYLLHLEDIFNHEPSPDAAIRAISGYRLRVWLSWVIMIIVAVYHKWITTSNNLFKVIYLLMALAFVIEGFYMQRLIKDFEIATNFQDPYTFGVLVSLLNFIRVAAMTALLQVGVWWFTRKWHRN